MRTFLCVLLTLIVILGLLAGCAKNETPPTTDAVDIFENSMQKSDPAQDDVINVLLVGNSGCYYYVEELYGIAKAAGIDMRICNVYYSGCSMEKHYKWWLSGEANYDFYVTDENGRNKTDGCNLEYCFFTTNRHLEIFIGF